MIGRYTTSFPLLFKISPIAPVLVFLNMPIRSMLLFYLAGVIVFFELVSRVVLQMPPSMLIRKITRGFLSMFFFSGLKNTPFSWRKKHWPLVFAFLCLLPLSDDSFAQYKVTDSMRWDRAWSAGAVGVSEGDELKALCRGCPIELALKQIIPKDFTIFVSDDVDKEMKVDFAAGERWGLLLSDIATQKNLKIEIMKHNSRVIVEPAAKHKGGVSVVTLMPNRKGFYESSTWELIPKDTLKSSLERWAAKEGWSVLSELDTDINIEVYAAFQGNLIEAVQQALESYRSVGVLSRVSMTYSHANNTIKIALAAKRDE